MTAQTFAGAAVTGATGVARRGRWVPWVLFGIELVGTSIVIGILSVVFVMQLTLNPVIFMGGGSPLWIPILGAVEAGLQLLIALAVFLLTGFIVGVLGLPIRFVPSLRRLWLANGEATVFGVLLGVVAIVVSYFPLGALVDVDLDLVDLSYPAYQPNGVVFLVGWFLLAFSLSMFVWPARWLPARARAWWTETQLTPRTR